MKNLQDIDRALRTVEAKVARLKASASEREDRVRSKIAALRGFTASEEATDSQRLEIRKALAALEGTMQNIMPPLEDVEKEVDRIYGDQSLNNTYYFSRRSLRQASSDIKVAAFLRQGEEMEIPWTDLSYDQVQDVVDDIYGNQSNNATYYFTRAAHTVRLVGETLSRRSSMSLTQIMDQMDSLYGDLSKNETYYPSRRYDEQARLDMVSTADAEDKEADWHGDEEHYLLSDDSDDSGHQTLSAGYEIPGYFANDNFDMHNTVAPTYRVDNTVETFGYGGDQMDEAPHVVQNRSAGADFLGMGLARHGVKVEKTHKGTMLMWEDHPMLSTDRAIVTGDDEPYTVTFYKGRKEVVTFRRLGKGSLVRILKDHMGLNLRKASPKIAALSGTDLRVLQAFLDHRPLEGKLLLTDGVTLEKMGMGGRVMAEWVRGKVEVTEESHVKSDEAIMRALKKHTPSRILMPSSTL